jgi:hypothetical protein
LRDFGKRGFRIANSPMETKVAYTGFLTFVFIGYLSIILIGLLRVGPSYGDIVAHYRGSELDESAFARPVGQMLEDTHFHAFIEGLILLSLVHIFATTSVRRSLKMGVILTAFGSTFTDLAAPWLIKFLSSGFAVFQMGAWVLMTATALILIAVPLNEMWFIGDKK